MKFREFTSKRGTKIITGRSAENNEELVAQVAPEELVFHTVAPGSPFVNLKGKPKFGDVKFAAIITAKYSQDWRDNKRDILVHQFRGKDINKKKNMKTGTFGVKNSKTIKVKKKWIEKFENASKL